MIKLGLGLGELIDLKTNSRATILPAKKSTSEFYPKYNKINENKSSL